MSRRGALIALALTAGCSSLQRVPLDYINEGKPDLIYVANSYGVVTTVQSPTLSGDTVYGVVSGQNRSVAVPLRQVESIKTMKFSTGRTVALVGAAAAATALVVYGISNGGSDTSWYCDWSDFALERNGGMPICGPRQPGRSP
jgi:hypothetical protein